MKKTQEMKKRADLILHPVRIRIITVLSGKQMTPGEVSHHLPDIPQASLYRHLKRLEQGGIIQVVKTRQVRGTIEKVYSAGDDKNIHFSKEDIEHFSEEEHTRFFSSFLAGLYAQFLATQNAAQLHPELLGKMGYHTRTIKIEPDKLQEFQQDFARFLQKYSADSASAPETAQKLPESDTTDKRSEAASERYYLTTILFPEVKNEP